MSRWRWLMAQLTRRLWVRATLIGALGILAAVLAAVVDRYIPWTMPGKIGADAVDSLLTIIASSMLAVTTFTLSTMVSAYGSATSNVTPRATKLLIEDRLTQTVLSTFIGSFLFGIVGLVVLRTGAYGERGRVVLFIMTVVVIALIVITLLRWIDHLTGLGRVGETTDRVEAAARSAIEARLKAPYLGGQPLRDGERDIPANAVPLRAGAIGYVQNVDMPALSRFCEAHDADLFVNAIPGAFVYADTPLLWMAAPRGADPVSQTERDDLSAAFAINNERSFHQDPRFGLAVLSEIACRALSPAVNDPGTAIDVIGRSTRLLCLWAEGLSEGEDAPRHPRVRVPPLQTADLFEDAFMTVARDGAGLIEVQLRIQKALLALSRMGDGTVRAAARHQSRMALDRAEEQMALDADKARLRDLVAGN